MKKILNLIFSRATVVGLTILLQVAWLSLLMYEFSIKYSIANMIIKIAALIAILVLNSNWSNPAYKVTWVCVILAFPIVGLVLYYIFGRSGLTKNTANKLERVNREVDMFVPKNRDVIEQLRAEDVSVANQSVYITEWARNPLYVSGGTQYYSSGEEMFPDMLKAIDSAQHFIFLEYFIIAKGIMWSQILEHLKARVDAGVEVRVIYDDFGCVSTLPSHYYRELEAMGIKCGVFNKIRPVLSVFMNNRDHRKIFVVDGEIAFTGGINLADEYINEELRFGYWKDAAIRIEGEAVWSMTSMFLEMWNYIKGTSEKYDHYYRIPHTQNVDTAKGYVQPYTDSPLDNENIGRNIYMNIINKAKRYVYIYTPYLIIDNEMMVALSNAAKSGVDVRIVMPGIPDKKMVFLLSQSYYAQLIRNGIKIYQFTSGFLHAKCFVCDDEIATVGSINLDYRSLYLHFENGIWMYRTEVVMQLKKDILETIDKCDQISEDFCKERLFIVRAVQSVFRVFAPLL